MVVVQITLNWLSMGDVITFLFGLFMFFFYLKEIIDGMVGGYINGYSFIVQTLTMIVCVIVTVTAAFNFLGVA